MLEIGALVAPWRFARRPLPRRRAQIYVRRPPRGFAFPSSPSTTSQRGLRLLTKDDWRTIRSCLLLRSMEEEDLLALIDERMVLSLERGEQLFGQDDPARALFLILEGRMKLSRLDADGGEAVVHIFAKAETFAEAAMFLDKKYPMSAVAVTPARVLAIASTALRARIAAKPDVAFAMLASMSSHLKALVNQIETMTLLTGEERIIRFLIDLIGNRSGAVTLTLPYEKTLIAKRLGMRPETFSRSLARLRVIGVEIKGATVAVTDVQSLRDRHR
ncbi:Crp/Fnr family transcriptional regulator [Hansschlegelia zhihuaiae]|uniref:Crp/Fnr family transcriptional regulator n=1 Tax=Hansschlegelia zhihuaiae TaxID=405005 RepID=UPI0013E8D9A2|nr:Crp/Fnr family transcriptional regulator [Hansschlegelia zhihuaiae]